MGISICPANNGKSQARTLEMRVFKEQTIESLLDGMLPRSGFVQLKLGCLWQRLLDAWQCQQKNTTPLPPLLRGISSSPP